MASVQAPVQPSAPQTPPQTTTTTPAQPATSTPDQPSSLIKALRTFESDVAEAMTKKKTSVASIALAQNRVKEKGDRIQTTESKHVVGKSMLFILSVILIGGGLIGGYYLY